MSQREVRSAVQATLWREDRDSPLQNRACSLKPWRKCLSTVEQRQGRYLRLCEEEKAFSKLKCVPQEVSCSGGQWQRCPTGSDSPRVAGVAATPAAALGSRGSLVPRCSASVPAQPCSCAHASQTVPLCHQDTCSLWPLAATDWKGSLHQGPELSCGRQSHLVDSSRQLGAFGVNPVPVLLLLSVFSCLKVVSSLH